MKKEELYSEIVNLPAMNKPNTENLKRLKRSIGWYEPENMRRGTQFFCNLKEMGLWWTIKGKLKSLWFRIRHYTTWEVTLEEGSFFTCKRQEDAQMMSYLVQIQEMLKRKKKSKKK